MRCLWVGLHVNLELQAFQSPDLVSSYSTKSGTKCIVAILDRRNSILVIVPCG